MDQKEKDRIAAEIAAEYRQTVRETADNETRNRGVRNRTPGYAKSIGVAYFLWFFGGTLGIHRFYLGNTASGAAMFMLTACVVIFSVMPAMFVFSLPLMALLGFWWLFDAFLIPRMFEETPTY